jgi:hypothetical protein
MVGMGGSHKGCRVYLITPLLISDTGGKAERVPQLTREGGRITVPQGSPLRNKLTVEAVGEK